MSYLIHLKCGFQKGSKNLMGLGKGAMNAMGWGSVRQVST